MAYDDDRLADYVDVAERIRTFRELYPEGSLQPFDPEHPFHILEIAGAHFVAYTAVAYRGPDDTRPGIAVAWEPFPGKTPYTRDSELQNAETAAWGRAIVAALAADTKKIASADEVRARREARDAGHPSGQNPPQTRQDAPRDAKVVQMTGGPVMATQKQEGALYAMSLKLNRTPPPKGSLTKAEAHELYEKLQAEINAQAAAPAAPHTDEEPF